jgi:hypothetical protein
VAGQVQILPSRPILLLQNQTVAVLQNLIGPISIFGSITAVFNFAISALSACPWRIQKLSRNRRLK